MSSYIEPEDYIQHSESSVAIDRHRLAEEQKEFERDKQRQIEEQKRQTSREHEMQREMMKERHKDKSQKTAEGLIIGSELVNLDPVSFRKMSFYLYLQ